MDEQAQLAYERAGMGGGFERGTSPCVLVVDFNRGSCDPECAHGMDLEAEVQATKLLLDAARAKGLPVIFTTNEYDPSLCDAGIWLQKIPALRVFTLGSFEAEIDPRLERRREEPLVVKKAVSPFFGTNLATLLTSRGVDTVILTGSTTSGCIRAASIDLVQYGYPTLVPRECVGDRARGPHEANLFDIQSKYADVVSLEEALAYLESVPAEAQPRRWLSPTP
jgi:maleamate amidohydrolase